MSYNLLQNKQNQDNLLSFFNNQYREEILDDNILEEFSHFFQQSPLIQYFILEKKNNISNTLQINSTIKTLMQNLQLKQFNKGKILNIHNKDIKMLNFILKGKLLRIKDQQFQENANWQTDLEQLCENISNNTNLTLRKIQYQLNKLQIKFDKVIEKGQSYGQKNIFDTLQPNIEQDQQQQPTYQQFIVLDNIQVLEIHYEEIEIILSNSIQKIEVLQASFAKHNIQFDSLNIKDLFSQFQLNIYQKGSVLGRQNAQQIYIVKSGVIMVQNKMSILDKFEEGSMFFDNKYQTLCMKECEIFQIPVSVLLEYDKTIQDQFEKIKQQQQKNQQEKLLKQNKSQDLKQIFNRKYMQLDQNLQKSSQLQELLSSRVMAQRNTGKALSSHEAFRSARNVHQTSTPKNFIQESGLFKSIKSTQNSSSKKQLFPNIQIPKTNNNILQEINPNQGFQQLAQKQQQQNSLDNNTYQQHSKSGIQLSKSINFNKRIHLNSSKNLIGSFQQQQVGIQQEQRCYTADIDEEINNTMSSQIDQAHQYQTTQPEKRDSFLSKQKAPQFQPKLFTNLNNIKKVRFDVNSRQQQQQQQQQNKFFQQKKEEDNQHNNNVLYGSVDNLDQLLNRQSQYQQQYNNKPGTSQSEISNTFSKPNLRNYRELSSGGSGNQQQLDGQKAGHSFKSPINFNTMFSTSSLKKKRLLNKPQDSQLLTPNNNNPNSSINSNSNNNNFTKSQQQQEQNEFIENQNLNQFISVQEQGSDNVLEQSFGMPNTTKKESQRQNLQDILSSEDSEGNFWFLKQRNNIVNKSISQHNFPKITPKKDKSFERRSTFQQKYQAV